MLKVYGRSDDLIEFEGIFDDEFNFIDEVGKFQIGDKKGGLLLEMFYENCGCWSAKVFQIDEGIPIPWPVSIYVEGKDSYSVTVEIDCPKGTAVKCLNNPEDEE